MNPAVSPSESRHASGLPAARLHWNLAVPALLEEALRRGEGVLATGGALACTTGARTGRSPRDKFIVRDAVTERRVAWGAVNQPFDADRFAVVERDLRAYLSAREVFVQDGYAGADADFRLPIRVVTELAWHGLFARHLFLRESDPVRLLAHEPSFTIVDAPGFRPSPERHGTHSDACVLVDFTRRLVLIGGTHYAGEIKKSAFSVLNFLLPDRGVLPMHCSANIGPDGQVAIFFGLSGTGKTTLSSDPARRLIGDDEHGWSDRGVFNFEGGCYAKLIRLSADAEPEIFRATRRFGAVLENVALHPMTRDPDFDDASLTENTRGAYPLDFIANHEPSGTGGHPRDVVLLTADAFGVMPPLARLTPAQAMYHFLSGYTARVAGTETGVTEPVAAFSACFGAPFLPLPPAVYASFLGRRLARHGSRTWLLNTGWTGGPYGTGRRMPLPHTRAMVAAALAGRLDDVPSRRDPVFGFEVPTRCPGVPDAVLDPRGTWQDAGAYDAQARRVASLFAGNFAAFAADVAPDVRGAGPAV